MKPEQFKAIMKSILKWDLVAQGTHLNQGSADCSLCKHYVTCAGCPIKVKTGVSQCRATPYKLFVDHQLTHRPGLNMCGTCADLVEQEIAFLVSLLPECYVDNYAWNVYYTEQPIDLDGLD